MIGPTWKEAVRSGATAVAAAPVLALRKAEGSSGVTGFENFLSPEAAVGVAIAEDASECIDMIVACVSV